MGSGLFPNVLGSRFVVRGLAPCWDRERRTSPRKRLGDVVSYACPLLGPGAGDKPPHYGFATYASRVFFVGQHWGRPRPRLSASRTMPAT